MESNIDLTIPSQLRPSPGGGRPLRTGRTSPTSSSEKSKRLSAMGKNRDAVSGDKFLDLGCWTGDYYMTVGHKSHKQRRLGLTSLEVKLHGGPGLQSVGCLDNARS